jgi:dihydroorotate dehydrogenase
MLARVAARTRGRTTLIGVGGIASGADAYAKIRAGASVVQLYTGLIYEGPSLVTRIKRELGELLSRDGFPSIVDAVGADVS